MSLMENRDYQIAWMPEDKARIVQNNVKSLFDFTINLCFQAEKAVSGTRQLNVTVYCAN